jgi:Protein of unknown function (DUF2950)
MKIKNSVMISLRMPLSACVALALCFLSCRSDAATAPEQKGFDTPELAVEGLIQGIGNFDVAVLASILGPGSEDLIASEDPVQDKSRAVAFAAKVREKNSIEVDPKNKDRATLIVGNEQWPLPIPIVKRKSKWYFDSEAGREEILLRRIGANELDAIQVCLGFVGAEQAYSLEKHDDFHRESIRAADHQHTGKTRWPGMAECRWYLGWSGWGDGSQSPARRLL